MKKKIFGGLAVLAIAVVAAFNVNVSVQENGLSDISLDNVEALASGEINPNCPNGCLTEAGSCWCNGGHAYREAKW